MRAFGAFAFVLLLCSQALAQQMMRPGTEPEDSFKGVWRFVGAQTAPWAKPRKLTKADAPLLEYAIDLKTGAVDGPPPFSCKDAAYTEGVAYHDDLFGGKLKGDKDFALARKIGLSQGEIDTERVICNGRTFDFYFTDNAQWLLGMDDVIYTLEQPAGMDPEQYTAGFSGPGFDCTKAKTAAEKAICTDASLSTADRKLNAAYARLKAAETPASFATVQAAQRAWLKYVLASCASGDADSESGDDLQQCLEDNYSDRAGRLEGAKAYRSGALVLEPRMRFFSKPKPETEDSDIYPWMTGGPPAAAFNAFVFKALQLGKRRMDDKNLFPFGDDVDDLKLYARRTYAVTRFDSRMVSLQVATYDYTGGAHEVLSEYALNWDMVRAGPILLDDVFDKTKPWKKFVTDFCLRDLKQQFGDQQSPDPGRAAVASVVADGTNWLWGKDKATVHFTVYTVTSFAGGEFDVDIPYAALKPFLRKDAPVP